MEFLKTILGDELYLALESKLAGRDDVKLANLAQGGYVAKEKFMAAANKIASLEAESATCKKQIAAAGEAVGQVQKLQDAIIKLQQEKEQMGRQFEERLMGIKREADIENALLKAKAKNMKAVRALIDESKITYRDGKLDGLKAQVEAAKYNDPYLFENDRDTGGGSNPTSKKDSVGSINPDRLDDKSFYNMRFKK